MLHCLRNLDRVGRVGQFLAESPDYRPNPVRDSANDQPQSIRAYQPIARTSLPRQSGVLKASVGASRRVRRGHR